MNSGDLVTLSTNTPTYLSTLLGKSEEIVLVHTVNDESYEPTNSCENTSTNTFMDITGSPLKVSLDNSDLLCLSTCDILYNPWTKEEEKQYPVSLNIARKFITEYCSKNRKNPDTKPVWCICDARDDKKTVLLSAQQTPQFIMNAVATLEGHITLNNPKLNLDNVCQKHLEFVDYRIETDYFIRQKKMGSIREVESNVLSIYEISGTCISSINMEDNSDIKGSVALEVTWNRCCQLPTENANSAMVIQAVIGHKESAAISMWKDLILLQLYMKALSEYNSETMVDNYWLPSSTDICEDKDLLDWVIEIISNSQLNPRYQSHIEGMDLHTIIESVNARPTKDITDHLWTVLTHCTTYGALRECLNALFTEIAYTDSKVYVSESNRTGIAEIIRGIAAGKLAVPTCTGTQPIELLIEIGMEKLKKDFILIFTYGGIADSQELNELFSNNVSEIMKNNTSEMSRNRVSLLLAPKKPVINLENTEKTMKALGQLQVVLEMLLIVPIDCVQCTSRVIYNKYIGPQSPIDSFSTLAKNKFQEIRIDVLYNEIYQYVNRINPVSWRLTLRSTRSYYTVQTVLHLSQRPIFPPSIYKPGLHEKSITETTQNYYYCTCLVQNITYLTK